MKQLTLGRHIHNYTETNKPRYAQLHRYDLDHDTKNPIRITSFNIKHSIKINKTIHMFGEHPELSKSQIICLQEMDHAGVKSIATALKMNYVYYPAILHPREDKDFGNAVLSKWPIIQDKKIILPQVGAGKLHRIATSATIKIANQEVLVYSVHLKVFVRKKHRRLPIEAITTSIPENTKHTVIAGDFNSFTKANVQSYLEPLLEAGFSLATKDIDWSYKHWYLLNKKSLLDFIFTSGLKTIAHGKAPHYKASDHFPIWADLQLL